MAQIVIPIPDAHRERLIAGASAQHGWNAEHVLTREQFVVQLVFRFLRDSVVIYETNAAVEQTRRETAERVKAEIKLVEDESNVNRPVKVTGETEHGGEKGSE